MSNRYDRRIDSEHFNPTSSHEKILMQIQPGSKVLECGCATGYMTRFMRDELGCEVSIVEYDAEAYAVARQYANDGICADLMQTKWLEKFKGEQFDYVLFADVLEHLYDPQTVLESVVPLLKVGGSILVSVPNVAHGDVLMNLWNGSWNYTETGLLDKTHIRFFAENNLESFFLRAGLSITRLDYIIRPVGQTEQACASSGIMDVDLKLLSALTERESASIFQFIIAAQPTEYVERHHIKQEKIHRKYQTMATLFYSQGDEFSEENTKRTFYSAPDLNQHFEWRGINPKALRFDPVEHQGCIVTSFQVLSNEGELKTNPLNGRRLGNTDIFVTEDPQYSIEVEDKSIAWIEIHAQIELLPNGQIQSGIAQLLLGCKELEAECAVQSRRVQELQEESQELQMESRALREQGEELRRQNEEEKRRHEELRRQNEEEKRRHEELRQRHDALGQQLARAENDYNTISNAFFWKITKPARVITDSLKSLMKKNRYTWMFCKGLKCLKQNGFSYTWKKLRNKMKQKNGGKGRIAASLSEAEVAYQRNYRFQRNVQFSILVPLYNTPEKFLHEMIQSVLEQTYGNWELCLADGSDGGQFKVEKICKQYMARDNRIKYGKLKENLGITGNTIDAYKMSTGDYFVLLDHDDYLAKNALFELCLCLEQDPSVDFIYSDRAIFHNETRKILAYHFLPSFSPEFLRSCNYASHLNAFSKWVIDRAGFLRMGYDGSQDYDLELRVIEHARNIVHIPKVLYYCRACEGSVALNPENKMYAYEAGRKAIEEHIQRIGYPGKVEFLANTFSYRIHYDLIANDKVTILIPNKDHKDDLERCIQSIVLKTKYPNYEIVVLENNSEEKNMFDFYKELEKEYSVRILCCPVTGFNYSAINNYGVKETTGKYILFLNNDTEVISDGWLTEMVMYAQRSDVGAVAPKLYYPDDTNQSMGLFIGLNGNIASYYDHKKSRYEFGYMNRLSMVQNYNAVTAACMLVKRADFMAAGGFDEEQFKVGLNDIDLCLKLRETGLINVVTPFAELYHYESKSRGSDEEGPAKERFEKEQKAFREKWKKYFDDYDLYTNPNFDPMN